MLLYYSGLKNCLTVRPKDGYSFADNTTYGLGGKAYAAYRPQNLVQARAAYDSCVRQDRELFIIGNGSNVLASDGCYSGNVIDTKRLSGIIGLDGGRLFCLAGTKISALLKYCRRKNLGGLEYLYGIPATVGGAAFMNAGAAGRSIGDDIVKVLIYDGKKSYLSHSACEFSYRHSTMRDIKCLICAVVLRVKPSSLYEIDSETDFFRRRREHLPKGRSCGCVFKNPQGQSAGALIEAAGLKGLTAGSAFVSPAHADFIVNRGHSARDVRILIETVKRAVKEKFGVLLDEEVVYIGDFNGTDG